MQDVGGFPRSHHNFGCGLGLDIRSHRQNNFLVCLVTPKKLSESRHCTKIFPLMRIKHSVKYGIIYLTYFLYALLHRVIMIMFQFFLPRALCWSLTSSSTFVSVLFNCLPLNFWSASLFCSMYVFEPAFRARTRRHLTPSKRGHFYKVRTKSVSSLCGILQLCVLCLKGV